MSIGDLIPILFLIFFVSQFFQRSKSPPPRTPPARPQATRPRAPAAPGMPAGRVPNASTAPASMEDELERMLREARERVRQAQQAERTQAPAPAPLVSADLDDGRLATPLPIAPPPPPKIPPRSSNPMVPPNLQGPAKRDLRAITPGIEVERRVGTPAAAPALGVRLDPRNVKEGFLWHVVLGEPRARTRGGGPFRR